MVSFRKKFILFLCSIFAFLLNASLVSALELKYPTILGKSLNDSSSIGDFVCYLFSAGVSLALSIATVVIVVGGVYYLISYGRGKYTDDGKDWVKAGILGLLIILCSSLIIYTINPDISNCKIAFLPQINLSLLTGKDPNAVPPNVTVATYHEIPIGTLTENLLTRVSECVDYNMYGDIMEQNPLKEIYSAGQPTTQSGVNQDRVVCMKTLVEGAQKKAYTAALLSDAITKLMNTCSCSTKDANGNVTSKCTPSCDPANGGCNVVGSCPGGSCGGNCIGAACKQPSNPTDCCPAGVLDKIEHGPVFIHMEKNQVIGGSAMGVNNVPCEKTCQTDVDCGFTGTFTAGNGQTENIKIEACDPDTHTCGRKYNGLDEFRCPPVSGADNTPLSKSSPFLGQSPLDSAVQNMLNPNNNKCSNIMDLISNSSEAFGAKGVSRVDPEKWYKLNLWQQLKWFNEILTDWKKTVGFAADEENLQAARTALNKCYLAVPYVDIVNTYAVSDQQKRINVIAPSSYTDFITEKPIAPTTYCSGFNYANATCLKHCNDICPDTGINAQSSGNADIASFKTAYMQRPCPYGDSSSSTFEDCMTGCQSSLKDTCGAEYPSCSPEYTNCDEQASDEGKCVLDNFGKCLFDKQGVQNFTNCLGTGADPSSAETKYCVNNAYLCKNGSDQGAGSKDCVNTKSLSLDCSSFKDSSTCQSASEVKDGPSSPAKDEAKKDNPPDGTLWGGCLWNTATCVGAPNLGCYKNANDQIKCKTIKGCTWQPASCSQNYYATLLFQNPSIQKCTNAYAPDKSNANSSCETVHPETASCPTSSDCSTCPCSKIDNTIKFYIPNRSTAISKKSCTSDTNCSSSQNQNNNCVNKVCTISKKMCSSNSDCSSSYSSNNICAADNKGKEQACTLDGKSCKSNTDCFADQACVEGICMVSGKAISCNSNADCTQKGQTCSSSDKICVISCSSDSDCSKEGEICSSSKKVCVSNAGDEGSNAWSPNIAIYQMVGPQCNSYSYNEDPLTFYCQDNWWNDPQKEKASPENPIGNEKKCNVENDIPVGQMVDDAITWAHSVGADIDIMISDTQLVLTQMTKIGNAKDTDPVKNYCKCDAQLGNSDPICTSGCKYNEKLANIPSVDSNGNQVVDSNGNPIFTQRWQCGCELDPCKGSPCQQIVDYQSQLWNIYKQFKRDYMDFDMNIITEPRSDILKELTYARQQTTSCSVTNTIYGAAQDRLLSCSRAEDELLPPINQDSFNLNGKNYPGYCYGQRLGQVAGKDLTDNWFCCQEQNGGTKKTTNNNPVYNINNNNF